MDLTATTDMKRIYVNTSFQLVNYLWHVLQQNSGLIIVSLFQMKKSNQNLWKCFKPNIYKTFPNLYPVFTFFILNIVTRGNTSGGHYLWRIWDVKISYCWGVIKTLLMWRTTLLLADCAWEKSCLRRKVFRRNQLHRHASFCVGDAEDFSSALHPPESNQ